MYLPVANPVRRLGFEVAVGCPLFLYPGDGRQICGLPYQPATDLTNIHATSFIITTAANDKNQSRAWKIN
jgi:hypothetical protein